MNFRYLLPIFLLTIVFISSSFTNNSKKVKKNETIGKSFMEAWSDHDSDKLLSLFAEDFTYEEVYSGKSYTDKNGLTGYMESTISGIPDSKFDILAVVANKKMAVVEWVWKGTNSIGWESLGIPATDKYFELRGVSVLTIENDLIKKCSDYWDWGTFMKGIGVN